ncbi:MAG: hypothetical protein EOM52_01615 [Clostridia bacterium]|nr:hypothetical protein [Clostridia bacterium]
MGASILLRGPLGGDQGQVVGQRGEKGRPDDELIFRPPHCQLCRRCRGKCHEAFSAHRHTVTPFQIQFTPENMDGCGKAW